MGNALQNAASLLVTSLFDLFLFVVLLRVLLQLVRADFYNPLSQFVVKVTTPVLRPFRRVIPSAGGVDVASLVLALITAFLKNALLFVIIYQLTPRPFGILLFSLADMIGTITFIYFLAIIGQIILSWVSPAGYNPLAQTISLLTEPLLSRVRRIIPPVAGFDLSPIPVLLGLQLINILVVATLRSMAGFFIIGS